MLLHNYRSRQFHSTLNGINPSSGFRDIGSTSLAQVLLDLTSFWPMGKPMCGKWANNYAVVQLQVSTSPRNFKWAKSIQQFQRYACHNVWTQFVANLTSFLAYGQAHMGQMGIWRAVFGPHGLFLGYSPCGARNGNVTVPLDVWFNPHVNPIGRPSMQLGNFSDSE